MEKICKRRVFSESCSFCGDKVIFRRVNFPFYYFVKIFDEVYRRKRLYKRLKIGIEYEDVLKEGSFFLFEKESKECTWTSNYEKGIIMDIFEIDRSEEDKMGVRYRTEELDGRKNIHYSIFSKMNSNHDYIFYFLKNVHIKE